MFFQALLQPPSLLLRVVGVEILLPSDGDLMTPGASSEQLARAEYFAVELRSLVSLVLVRHDSYRALCSPLGPNACGAAGQPERLLLPP